MLLLCTASAWGLVLVLVLVLVVCEMYSYCCLSVYLRPMHVDDDVVLVSIVHIIWHDDVSNCDVKINCTCSGLLCKNPITGLQRKVLSRVFGQTNPLFCYKPAGQLSYAKVRSLLLLMNGPQKSKHPATRALTSSRRRDVRTSIWHRVGGGHAN